MNFRQQQSDSHSRGERSNPEKSVGAGDQDHPIRIEKRQGSRSGRDMHRT